MQGVVGAAVCIVSHVRLRVYVDRFVYDNMVYCTV